MSWEYSWKNLKPMIECLHLKSLANLRGRASKCQKWIT
jgi:hypothetical protein